MVDDFDEGMMFPVEKAQAPQGNPLSQYFRLPGLSVELPTNGAYMPKGSISFSPDGSLEVYPMRGSDEMLLMSPDALMNNSAVINLLRSCVPQITQPEEISVPDLDVLLLAIRVASTGSIMEITLECEECQHENKFDIDVPEMIQTAGKIAPTNTIRVRDDMVVWIKPITVRDQTTLLNAVFRETRKAQALELNSELSADERTAMSNEIMKSIAEMSTFSIAHSIVKIVVPNGEVTNSDHILEFLEKTDRKTINLIKSRVEELNQQGVDKTFQAACGKCKHEWTASVEFDPSSFFGERSSD